MYGKGAVSAYPGEPSPNTLPITRAAAFRKFFDNGQVGKHFTKVEQTKHEINRQLKVSLTRRPDASRCQTLGYKLENIVRFHEPSAKVTIWTLNYVV